MPAFWIGQRKYQRKGEAEETVRKLLHGHKVGYELEGEEFDLIRDLLDMHHEAADKIGSGVKGIRIAPPLIGKWNGFEVIRTDGTSIDFSYKTCFKAPSLRSQVHNVMRAEVNDLTSRYFDARLAAGRFTSDLSGVALRQDDTAVSHFQGPSFAEIADRFAESEGGWESIPLTPSSKQGLGDFVDREQADRWRVHWEQNAVLGLLTQAENLSRRRS